MSPEDREVYRFAEAHYPDLRETWEASQAYYRAEYQKAHRRAAVQPVLDEQIVELQALATALETAALAIRRVCYKGMRARQKEEPTTGGQSAQAREKRED